MANLSADDQALTEKRQQVVAQYRVIAHLCKQIGRVHEQLAEMHEDGHADQLLDMVGRDTADRMEVLGNMANNMDIVTDDDAWLDPIYMEAHKRWPQPRVRSGTMERLKSLEQSGE